MRKYKRINRVNKPAQTTETVKFKTSGFPQQRQLIFEYDEKAETKWWSCGQKKNDWNYFQLAKIQNHGSGEMHPFTYYRSNTTPEDNWIIRSAKLRLCTHKNRNWFSVTFWEVWNISITITINVALLNVNKIVA